MSVTVIGGDGTGLLDSSLALLNRNESTANDQTGAGEALYVNVSNGDLVLQHRDAYLPSLGADFDLIRTYNSRGQTGTAGNLDGRWELSTGISLSVIPGFPRPRFEVTYGDGSTFTYAWDNARQLYVSTNGDGAFETIQDLGFTPFGDPRYVLTQADQTKLYFSSSGDLLRSEDTNGVRMEYVYSFGRLSQIRDDQGHRVNFNYNILGQLYRVTDETGAVLVEYHYDFGGRLSEVVDRMGHVTRYFYTSDGLLSRVSLPTYQDANGDGVRENYATRDIQFEYGNEPFPGGPDGNPRVLRSVTDAEGGVTTFNYDFDFNLGGFTGGTTQVVDALGNNRAYSNDQQYRDWRVANGFYSTYNALLAATNPSYASQVNSILTSHSLTYSYQANGYITQLTDQQGYRTQYAYDNQGNLITVTDRNGWAVVNSDSAYYRALRAQLGYVDASGNGKLVSTLTGAERNALREAFTSHFRYDSRGNLLEAEDNNGSITSFTYTSFNKTATMTNARGNTTTFTYDAKQNLIEQRDPGGDLTRFEYDAAGNRTKATVFLDASNLTDPSKQQITRYFYDAFGNNIETVDAEGDHTFAQYDHFGNVTRLVNANGGVTTYTYDKDNRLLTVTDPEGQTTLNAYDAVGNRISMTDASGHTVYRFYDRDNRLITILDPSATTAAQNRTTTFTYDVVGNQKSVTDAEGRTTTYTFNARHEIVEIVSAEVTAATGGTTKYHSSFSYDGQGNRITQTDNRGFTTSFIYNEDGLLSERKDPNGNITRYSYDANNNQMSIIVGMQLPASKRQTVRFSYDEEDHLETQTDAEGHSRTFTYDAIGNVKALVDENGNQTNYEYDRNNRLLREIEPAVIDPTTGVSTRYVIQHRYDALGNEVEVIDQNGHSTLFTFDKDSRLVVVTDANGIQTKFAYDAKNNRTSVQIGEGSEASVTRYVYDEFNQLTSRTDALGNTSHFAYDRVGNTTSQIDNEGRQTRFVYDALNRLQTTVNALGGTEQRRYDGANHLVSVTDANNHSSTFTYDSVGLRTSLTDANGITTQFAYDAFGNVITETRAAGLAEQRTTQYVYDLNGRLKSQTDAEGITASFEYDAVGNRLRIVDGLGNATQTFYDALNRVIKIVDPLGFESKFEYDGADNRIAIIDNRGAITRFDFDAGDRLIKTTDAEGRRTSYAYDIRGNKIAVRTAVGTAQEELTTFEYDAQNNLRRVIDATGSVESRNYDRVYNLVSIKDGNGNVTTNEFDALNRMIRTIDAEGAATTFRYDAVNNLLERTDGNGKVTSWTYDAVNRATVERAADGVEKRYVYDALGNRVSITLAANTAAATTTTYTYDRDDRLISQTDALGNTTSYRYDSNGNRVMVRDPLGHETTYIYDANNRVSQVIDALGYVVQYRYDGNGNRVQVIDPRGTATTSYFNADNEIVLEIDGEGYARTWEYDNNGNVVSQTLFARPISSADPNVRPTLVSDARDQTTRYEHDAANRVSATIDAEGYRTEFRYDAGGNQIEIRSFRDRAGTVVAVTHITYDRVDRVVEQVTAEGYRTQIHYDAVGNVLSRTVFDRSPGSARVTSYTYDAVYRVTDETSALNVVTHYEYDARGNKTAVIDAYGTSNAARTVLAFDAVNRLIDITDANGVKTHYVKDANGNITDQYDAYGTTAERHTVRVYDSDNRLTRETNALGFVTQYEYDASSNILSKTLAAGTPDQHVSRYEYDRKNRQTVQINAAGERTESAYDAAGNRIRVTIAPGLPEQRVNTFEFDRDNRLVAAVDAEGIRTEYRYDGAGNKTETIQGVGIPGAERHTFYKYDLDSRVVQITDPMGGVTSFEYDVLGNQTRIVNANGGVQVNTFDAVGQLLSTLSAGGILTVNVYDLRGNTVSTTQSFANGTDARTTFYTYDLIDQKVAITDGEGFTTSFQYDAFGNQVAIINGQYLLTPANAGYDAAKASRAHPTTNTFVFDAADRMLSITDGEGNVTTYSYNAVGDRLTMTEAANSVPRTTQYKYDLAHRVIEVVNPEGGITRDAYDAAGNRVAEHILQSVSGGTEVWIHHYYEYDKNAHVTAEIDGLGVRTEYDYDAMGNNTVVRTAAGTSDERVVRKEYDLNNRKTADVDGEGSRTTYVYDALGNRIRTTDALGRVARYYFDGSSRLIEVLDPEGIVNRFTYDSAGNQIENHLYANRYTGPIDDFVPPTPSSSVIDRVTLSTYDRANHNIRLVEADGSTTLRTYDGSGNVLSEQLYANTSAPRTHTYVYDLNNRLTQFTDADGTVTYFAWDGANNKTSERIVSSTDPNAVRETQFAYDLNNRLIRQTFDPSGLSLVQSMAYDRAGNVVATTDPNGHTTTFAFDLANRQTRETNALGQSKFYGYDRVGNRTSVTDARGATTDYVFDQNNRLIEERSPAVMVYVASTDQYTTQRLVTRHVYDALGNEVQTIDAVGGTTTSYFDANQHKVAELSADNVLTRWHYNAFGEVESQTLYMTRLSDSAHNPNTQPSAPAGDSRTTELYYDVMGRLARTVYAQIEVTSVTIDGAGNPVTTKSLKRPEERTVFDAFGNPVEKFDKNGNRTVAYFDVNGRAIAQVDAEGYLIEWEYDAQGNLLEQRVYAGKLDPSTVSPNSRPTPPAGEVHTLSRRYDAANRLIAEYTPYSEVVDASGVSSYERVLTTISYDKVGNQISRTRAAGTSQAATEHYYYDAANRQIAIVNANRVLHVLTFDANGNVTQQARYFNAISSGIDLASLDGDSTNFLALVTANGNDQVTVRNWDAANRLSSQTDLMSNDGGADDITKSYRYSAVGLQTWVSDGTGRVNKFDYDRVGRVVRNLSPDGTGSVIEYDAAGNQIYLYTGQADVAAQPAQNITVKYGDNLVIGWDMPPGSHARSWVVWDTSSHANLADYATKSEELATWYSANAQLYIPASAFGVGSEIYFRVVTADASGNLSFTKEQVVQIPPRLSNISVQRTGTDSARVQVTAASTARNLVLRYGAPGTLSNTITMVLQSDGTYTADLSGITNLNELAYQIDWSDPSGGTYSTGQQRFNAPGEHLGVSTTLGESTSSNGTETRYTLTTTVRVPASLAQRLSTVVASWQNRGQPGSSVLNTAVTGVDNGDGTWTFTLTLGAGAQSLAAGDYRIVLTGLFANASEIEAQDIVLDQFDVTFGGAPVTGTHQSLTWPAANVGAPGSQGQIVIVDGKVVDAVRDPDSQQLTVETDLTPGTHGYDALYGSVSGTQHNTSITSTEVTEQVPDPTDPNAPPTTHVLGYDVSFAVDFDASETARLNGGLHLAWRGAGGGLEFANDVTLDATGNHFSTTLSKLAAGSYDVKLYYVDANGHEVIVDWLRIDAKTVNVTQTTKSLTVLASETDGSISLNSGGLPVVIAGIFSGGADDSRNYVSLAANLTGLDGGSVRADGRSTGYYTESRYNALNQLIATNADTGLWREFGVDANGNQVATYVYGEQGNSVVHDSYAVFDGRNRKTEEFSVATSVQGSSTPQRAITHFGYDVFDNEVEVRDALGNTTLRSFNAFGSLLRERDRLGGVTLHSYDRLGNQAKTVDALGNVSTKSYDLAGRLVQEVNGEGNVTQYGYDTFDRRVEVRNVGDGRTVSSTMTYDQHDRMTSFRDANGLTTNFQYDKRDNRIGVQDANGNWTTQDFDDLNRVVATHYKQNGVDITERRQYDAYGNLVAEIDGAGRTQATMYGEFGRKLAEIDAAGRQTSFEYDKFGNLIREYRPASQSFSNSGWNGGLGTNLEPWEYALLYAQWNLTNGPLPDIRSEYDVAGRLTRISDLVTGVTTTYSYDLNGNRKQEDITGTGGHDRHLTYNYDAEDQMTRWADSVTGMHLNYLWDAAGNQKRVYTDPGYSQTVNHWYEYDGANRLTSETDGQGGSVISGYGYDAFGNRKTWNNAGVVVTYQFDDAGRVTSGHWSENGENWDSAWTYDNNGNVLTYVTRKNGNVETSTTNRYSENNLSVYTNTDGQETRNTFDNGQRLTRVEITSDGSTTTYTYSYYADGREREIVGQGNKKAAGTTKFTYDANDHQVRVDKGQGDGMDRPEYLTFVYDNDGHILYRFHDEGKGDAYSTEYQYANGNPVGERKNQNGTITELLDSGQYNLVQSFGEDVPTSSVTSVTVVEGDTLQAIAARVYGNPSLWFVLAEANGLDPSQPLKAGTRLKVPNTIESGSITADTHVVYNESDIIGSALPNLKTPAKKKGCGSILAIIIIVVIAVVATIVTAGLAGALLAGGSFIGLTGTAATIAAYAVAGAVVGAAASIVQQGIFIALDYQDSFSWKDVAAGAVSGAFSGAAQGVGKAVELGQILKASSTYARVAASALKVAGEASKQLISSGKITSWASLAGAAIAPTRNSLTGDEIFRGIGGLSANAVNMVTPWLETAESYFRHGELTTADWVSAAGSTLSAAVNGDTPLGQMTADILPSNLGRNLLIGGAMYAVDHDTGRSFLENAIGQEVGNFIGSQLVDRTGLRQWAKDADQSYSDELDRQKLVERIKALETAKTEAKFTPVLLADASVRPGVVSDVMTPEEERAALLYGIQKDLEKGLGDYSKVLGVLNEKQIERLKSYASQGREMAMLEIDDLADYFDAMGIKGQYITPASEMPISTVVYSKRQVLDAASAVVDALSQGLGADLDLDEQLVYVKDPKASKDMLKKAVVNFVGGRADAAAYQDLFNRIDASKSNRLVLNVTYAYAQSDARAAYAALQTSYGSFIDEIYKDQLKNFGQALDAANQAPWYLRGQMGLQANHIGAGAGLWGMIEGISNNISFARDAQAPADVRSGARKSLFIDAALMFGPAALGLAAKGAGMAIRGVGAAVQSTKLTRTFAALNSFASTEELASTLAMSAELSESAIQFRKVSATVRFLKEKGITDIAMRRQFIESGFDASVLGADTPITMARFEKLFPDAIAKGRSFSGRLGNVDTRVATINQAADLERRGLEPLFEYPVRTPNATKAQRFLDVVGRDPATGQIKEYYQFVKETAGGTIKRADEYTAAAEIERALGLKSGTVKTVNTQPH